MKYFVSYFLKYENSKIYAIISKYITVRTFCSLQRVSKKFNEACQNNFIWKKILIFRIEHLYFYYIMSITGIFKNIDLLKSICAKYSHLQLPNGYYRETLKKLRRMERV